MCDYKLVKWHNYACLCSLQNGVRCRVVLVSALSPCVLPSAHLFLYAVVFTIALQRTRDF